MGRYDDEIIQLARDGVSPSEIAKRLNIGRMTVYKARKKAGLVDATPEYEIRVIPFIPEQEHQSQHAYIMLKLLERDANGLEMTDKMRARLEGFRRGLAKKVWIYERKGDGFRAVKRKPEHGDKVVIEI